MFGDVTLKSRPLRFALFIRPTKLDLIRATRLNTSLWGGGFNPIIPVYARAPAEWKDHPHDQVSAKNWALGYVRAFDPDILVNMTGAPLPQYLHKLGRDIVNGNEFWAELTPTSAALSPKYGIGVLEALGKLYKDYFEHTRRFPVRVLLPNRSKKYKAFWAVAVGDYPDEVRQRIDQDFSKAVDFEITECDVSTLALLGKPGVLGPRAVISHGLTMEGRRGDETHYAYLLDADHFGDLVGYWNLRALGNRVLAVPKHLSDDPTMVEIVREYVRSNYRISSHNPKISYGTNILKGKSATADELKKFVSSLDIAGLKLPEGFHSPLAQQHWYPRIWNEWAQSRAQVRIANLVAETDEISFRDTDGDISFKLHRPEFAAKAGLNAKFATAIYSKFYGEKDAILADILPYDHGENVIRAAGGRTFSQEFRIGRTGLVRLASYSDRTYWRVPLAEDVFFAWLKDKGYQEPKLSTCGILAKQVYVQLEGWLRPLGEEVFIKLIDDMNTGGEGGAEGKGAKIKTVRDSLKAIDKDDRLYRSLVKHGVFQIGWKTQCPHCRRASWYSANVFAADLRCPLCQKSFTALDAVDTENSGAWHLKTAGAFSVPRHADGSFPVLLTLRFFEQSSLIQITPALSFVAKDAAGKELEADLGLLWQQKIYGEEEDGVLFAECKSYNQFTAKDYARMRAMAKKFPGAVLAFCTLRNKLNPKEVKEIAKIATKGARYWKNERPINPVLVLTGKELLGFGHAPQCWKDIAPQQWIKDAHSLLEMCNATQVLHLNMPGWHEIWDKQFKKRQSRREMKELLK